MILNISTNATLFNQKSISLDTAIYLLTNVIPYFPLVWTILGLIGFIGNSITFLQHELRSKPCCIYIFCSSIVDIIHLAINVFPYYLHTKYGIRLPWDFSTSLCKLYFFLYSFLPQLAINILILNIIGRFACTCSLTSRIQRLNRLKLIPQMIIIAVIVSCILSIYAPVLAYINPLGCVYTEQRVYGMLNIFINGVIQPIVMLIFVFLTYRNIRKARQRIGEIGIIYPNRFRNQFIAMIITQVLVTGFISLQWMIGQTYILFNMDKIKTINDLIIIILFLSFTVSFYAFNNVKSFYFSLLTSKLYRQIFVKGLKRLLSHFYHL